MTETGERGLAIASLERVLFVNATRATFQCPVCGDKSPDRVYEFKEFAVLKCGQCTVSWRSNMYTPDMIVQMYVNEDYDQHPFFSYERDNLDNPKNKRFTNFARALAKMRGEVGPGRLLDVACGSGMFLALAEQHGWEVSGVEISPALSTMCKKNTRACIYTAPFEAAELPPASFDVITFWDIIEHVLDPVAFIAKARSLLKPGGMVLFCTPDEESLLANVGRTLYRISASRLGYPALALHPRFHTFFFSRSSLSRLLQQQGLQVIDAYSQEAFFQHSTLASQVQKKAISRIEQVARWFDACYECVVIARLEAAAHA